MRRAFLAPLFVLACSRAEAPPPKQPTAQEQLEDWEKGLVDIPDRESCVYCPTGECEPSYSDPATLRCARRQEPRPPKPL